MSNQINTPRVLPNNPIRSLDVFKNDWKFRSFITPCVLQNKSNKWTETCKAGVLVRVRISFLKCLYKSDNYDDLISKLWDHVDGPTDLYHSTCKHKLNSYGKGINCNIRILGRKIRVSWVVSSPSRLNEPCCCHWNEQKPLRFPFIQPQMCHDCSAEPAV